MTEPGPNRADLIAEMEQWISKHEADIAECEAIRRAADADNVKAGEQTAFADEECSDCEDVSACLRLFRAAHERLREQEQVEEKLTEAREESEKLKADYADLQKHRDAWRGYAYGEYEKPDDFLDGSMVDRPQTALEKAREENARLRKLAREATNGWACYAKRKIEHDEIARLHRELAALSTPEAR